MPAFPSQTLAMAAPDTDTHEPLIKTPKQLVLVVVLAFAVPIALALLLAHLATSGLKEGNMSAESIAERIKPVASVNVGAAESETKGAKTGEQIVQSTCGACHQTGAAGAPKIGDKAAWAPRIGKGLKGLMAIAMKGAGAMPARGGNPDLSEAEIERAIVFMANQSGASFKESAAAK